MTPSGQRLTNRDVRLLNSPVPLRGVASVGRRGIRGGGASHCHLPAHPPGWKPQSWALVSPSLISHISDSCVRLLRRPSPPPPYCAPPNRVLLFFVFVGSPSSRLQLHATLAVPRRLLLPLWLLRHCCRDLLQSDTQPSQPRPLIAPVTFKLPGAANSLRRPCDPSKSLVFASR